MKDLMGMVKQAQQLQAKMQEMQDNLASMEIEGCSGAGLVSITLSGKGDIRTVKIDPSLMKAEEVEILEDLLVAAAADAKAKLDSELQQRMQQLTGGLPLPPGLKLF